CRRASPRRGSDCSAARWPWPNCRRAARGRQSLPMSTFAPAVDFAAAALLGVDFSCSPSPRKPITVARGRLDGERLVVDAVDALPTLAGFDALLCAPGPW